VLLVLLLDDMVLVLLACPVRVEPMMMIEQ